MYDPLGRLFRSVDTAGVMTDHAYRVDATNHVSYAMSSNPYTVSSALTGWTLATHDPLGRVVNATSYAGPGKPGVWGSNGPVSGVSSANYNASLGACMGPVQQSTDAASHTTGTCVNGAGQPSMTKGTDGTVESYVYDALGNVTQAMVSGQARTFTYSSLSRLKSACSPENSTSNCSSMVQYSYDLKGNLKIRTNANGVKLTLSYDALDRPLRRVIQMARRRQSSPMTGRGISKDLFRV